jgi:hypothetical protein
MSAHLFVMFAPKIVVSTFAFLCVSLFFAAPAWAKDFKADYTVDYTVQPDINLTHVRQRVTLTNLVSNLRASSYSLTLDAAGYKNLTASDAQGKLTHTDTKADDGTPTITFTFNDRVVGVGNQLKWTIDYDSPSIAQRHGQVWDISIPRVKEHPSYDIASYAVNLFLPKSVGKEAYISPAPVSTSHTDSQFQYHFNKEQILPTGVVAAFGDAQVFDFTLKYHLQNPNLGQASTEIALPADLPPHQQIIYNKLDPQPVSMRTDLDGNTLATYYLKSQQQLDVTFTGWARNRAIEPDLSSKKLASTLPTDLVKAYTVEQKYWETSDPELIKKTKELTDPSKPAVENERAIYQYVTTTLQYNTARINKDLKRLGASTAFRNPKNAVCMEFTDLFVTMSRIAGIPAREVDGYAYTTDSANQPIFYPGLGSDILHAWAQIYLPDAGWVPVDPTWGSTTGGVDFFGRLDLNRIAFAIKGRNSQTPYAAGSYKTNDKQDGDVKVSFSTEPKVGQAALTASLSDHNLVAGIGGNLPLAIKNTGNVAAYSMDVSATTDAPAVLGQVLNNQFAVILPNQTINVWLPLSSKSWLDNGTSTVHLTAIASTYDDQPLKLDESLLLHIAPFYMNIAVPFFILLLVVLATISGGWYALQKLYHRSISKTGNSLVDTTPSSSTTV